MNERLLEFLKGEWFDPHGRMIDDIYQWDNDRLEYVHDYIQWVFPLKEESMFNASAPLLDDETIEAIKDSPTCLANIRKMSYVMEDFYELWDHERYESLHKWWMTPNNHNYLRITRILTCLNLVGLHDEMKALFGKLTTVYNVPYNSSVIGDSYNYWKSAVEV